MSEKRVRFLREIVETVTFTLLILFITGDTVSVTTSSVTINGETIQEPYIRVPFNFDNKTWKLGANQFFVMGNNRDNSLDSRMWGPLDRSYIIGKVVVAYWPMNYLGLINTYPAVYAAVPPGK